MKSASELGEESAVEQGKCRKGWGKKCVVHASEEGKEGTVCERKGRRKK